MVKSYTSQNDERDLLEKNVRKGSRGGWWWQMVPSCARLNRKPEFLSTLMLMPSNEQTEKLAYGLANTTSYTLQQSVSFMFWCSLLLRSMNDDVVCRQQLCYVAVVHLCQRCLICLLDVFDNKSGLGI